MFTLDKVLFEFNQVHLRAIARLRGIMLSSGSHREMVDQLSAALLTPESIEQAVLALGAEARQALEALQRTGGKMRSHVAMHQFGPIRRVGPGRLEREETWKNPAGPLESLWYQGFIGRGFRRVGDETPDFVYIPDDVLSLLPPAGPEPEIEAAPAVSDPAIARLEPAGQTLLPTLYEFLLHIQLQRPRTGDGQGLDADGLRALDLRLAPADARQQGALSERLDFIQHLSRQEGLLDTEAGRLRLAADHARNWLDRPAVWQMRALLERWRMDAEWNDLWHVPQIRCERAGWENDPVRSRERFLAQLEPLAVDAWHAVGSLTEQIKTADPDFQRPHGDYNSWYIRDVESDTLLTGFEHWDAIEGTLIAYYLQGPLHWLGVVDLGYGDADGIGAQWFRITASGKRFLAGEVEIIEEAGGHPIELEGDLTVWLREEATLYYRLQVERFAERLSEDGVFRITPASLLTARSQNIRPASIISFLERASASPLPEAIQDAIRERWSTVESIQMRRLVTLDFADPAVVTWLQNDPECRHLLGDILFPTRIQLPERQLSRLLNRLRQLGLQPEVTHAPEN